MNDEQQLLASAYLDDALTDDERARAEADPDVMAAVEQLREIRNALSTVDPPDAARRDAAINAALRTFDAERRPAAPPPVSSLASRRANKWLVGAAAALVLVIAGGILASRDNDGGDDDSAGGGAAATDAATEAAGGGGVGADTSGATAEADTRSAQDTAGAAPTPESIAGGAATTAAAPAATALSNAELPLPASEFLQYASSLARTSQALDSTPKCDGGRFLGRHVVSIDGKNIRVEIFYNRRAGEYIALNARTCEPLISAQAP